MPTTIGGHILRHRRVNTTATATARKRRARGRGRRRRLGRDHATVIEPAGRAGFALPAEVQQALDAAAEDVRSGFSSASRNSRGSKSSAGGGNGGSNGGGNNPNPDCDRILDCIEVALPSPVGPDGGVSPDAMDPSLLLPGITAMAFPAGDGFLAADFATETATGSLAMLQWVHDSPSPLFDPAITENWEVDAWYAATPSQLPVEIEWPAVVDHDPLDLGGIENTATLFQQTLEDEYPDWDTISDLRWWYGI